MATIPNHVLGRSMTVYRIFLELKSGIILSNHYQIWIPVNLNGFCSGVPSGPMPQMVCLIKITSICLVSYLPTKTSFLNTLNYIFPLFPEQFSWQIIYLTNYSLVLCLQTAYLELWMLLTCQSYWVCNLSKCFLVCNLCVCEGHCAHLIFRVQASFWRLMVCICFSTLDLTPRNIQR